MTAGAFDIEEAWLDQLALAGRLVVPLRLAWPSLSSLCVQVEGMRSGASRPVNAPASLWFTREGQPLVEFP